MFFKCFLNVSCNEKKTFKKRHRNIFLQIGILIGFVLVTRSFQPLNNIGNCVQKP